MEQSVEEEKKMEDVLSEKSDEEITQATNELMELQDVSTMSMKEIRNSLEESLQCNLDDKKELIKGLVEKYLYEKYIKDNEEDGDAAMEEEDKEVDENANGEEDEEEEAANTASSAKKAPKINAWSAPLALSSELAEFIEKRYESRANVVKQIWAHIHAKNLQNPAKKSEILCDETLQKLFKRKKTNMFQMQKLLSKMMKSIKDLQASCLLDTDEEVDEDEILKKRKQKVKKEESAAINNNSSTNGKKRKAEAVEDEEKEEEDDSKAKAKAKRAENLLKKQKKAAREEKKAVKEQEKQSRLKAKKEKKQRIKRHAAGKDSSDEDDDDEEEDDKEEEDEVEEKKVVVKKEKESKAKKAATKPSTSSSSSSSKKASDGSGGYELYITPELLTVLQEDGFDRRPALVKKLWEYIKGHNLQNPKDKREILLDEALQQVFKVKSFTCFSMNKYLSKHCKKKDE